MDSRPKARCANYQLRSVVHHHNGMMFFVPIVLDQNLQLTSSSAHYITYGVRNGTWWKFNDSEVTKKNFAEVQTDAARGCVMLLYDICEGKNVLPHLTTL